MSTINKKKKNNQETIVIKEAIPNILVSLFNFIRYLLGSIYKNILIYIIIFLLFIIAFKSFINIPLDLLLNYMYLPEFLQNLISLFQTNEAVNTSQIIAKVNTDSLELAIKEISAVQTNMISLLEKQNETIAALSKSVESLSVQQNATIGLNKVVEQLQLNNKLTNDLVALNKTAMKLTRATHDASMLKLNAFEQIITNSIVNLQQDIVSNLNSNHKDYISCLQNNNMVLRSLQEHTINAFVLNQDILAATKATTELQQAGFEALLQSSTNNHEYLTTLQDHQYLVENKLQQISKENTETALRIKEEIVKSSKELEKSTAIGFLKDKVSNYNVDFNNSNIKKDN